MDGHVPSRHSIERLARWWTEASNEARFTLLRASLAAEKEAPDFRALQIAIYLAEAEAGEIAQG